MKLKKLTLANFRGFEQIDIEFGDLTVIAGINGIGKSTILQAIALLMSYANTREFRLRGSANESTDADIQIGRQSYTVVGHLAQSEKVTHFATITRERDYKGDLEGLEIKLKELRDKLKKIKAGDVRERIRIHGQLRQIQRFSDERKVIFSCPKKDVKEDGKVEAPLFIYYSSSRYAKGLPSRSISERNFSEAAAFTNALRGIEISYYDFTQWLRAASEGAFEASPSIDGFYSELESVIAEVTPDFGKLKLELPEKGGPRLSIEKQGSRFNVEQLSDGEQGLLSLIFDLTKRLVVANQDTPNPTKEAVATVLIDEIELHLHPTWQRRVLRRLQKAFPKCQFIVSTHSPMILSEVDASDIRFLYRDSESGKISFYIPDQAFGLDANQMLDEMGAHERNEKVEKSLNQLFKLIDEEKFDKARKTLESLRKILGESDPEITRAESLIAFLEEE